VAINLTRAPLDTSVFIADEFRRPLGNAALRDQGLYTVITIAEVHAGVLATGDTETRSRRLATPDTAGPALSHTNRVTVEGPIVDLRRA
jgi:hypothetical protein